MWCAVNLSWVDSSSPAASSNSSSSERIQRMRELGFDRKLALMQDDPDLDVRDRVKTALEMMDRSVDEMKT